MSEAAETGRFAECAQIFEGHSEYITGLKVVGHNVFSSSYDRTLRRWDIDREECIAVYNGHDDGVRCLDVVGNHLYSGSNDESARLWDVNSGVCKQIYEGHTDWVNTVSALGDKLYTGSYDDTLRAWDIETAQPIVTFQGHARSVNCMQLYGNILYSGSYDTTLRAWDIRSGECVRVFKGHTGWVRCVEVQEGIMLSGSEDATIRVWDLHSGECLRLLTGHSVYVKSLQTVGPYFYSSSGDCTVRQWEHRTLQCVDVVKNCNTCLEIVGQTMFTGAADGKVRAFVTDEEIANSSLPRGSFSGRATPTTVPPQSGRATPTSRNASPPRGSIRGRSPTPGSRPQSRSQSPFQALQRALTPTKGLGFGRSRSPSRNRPADTADSVMDSNRQAMTGSLTEIKNVLDSEETIRQDLVDANRLLEQEIRVLKNSLVTANGERLNLETKIGEFERASMAQHEENNRLNEQVKKLLLQQAELDTVNAALEGERNARIAAEIAQRSAEKERDLWKGKYDNEVERAKAMAGVEHAGRSANAIHGSSLEVQLEAMQSREMEDRKVRVQYESEIQNLRAEVRNLQNQLQGAGTGDVSMNHVVESQLRKDLATVREQLVAETAAKDQAIKRLAEVQQRADAHYQSESRTAASQIASLEESLRQMNARMQQEESERKRLEAAHFQMVKKNGELENEKMELLQKLGAGQARMPANEQDKSGHVDAAYTSNALNTRPASSNGAIGASPAPPPAVVTRSPEIGVNGSANGALSPPKNQVAFSPVTSTTTATSNPPAIQASPDRMGSRASGIEVRCSQCNEYMTTYKLDEHMRTCKGVTKKKEGPVGSADEQFKTIYARLDEKTKRSLFGGKKDDQATTKEGKKTMDDMKIVVKALQLIKPGKKLQAAECEKNHARLDEVVNRFLRNKSLSEGSEALAVSQFADHIKSALKQKRDQCVKEERALAIKEREKAQASALKKRNSSYY